MTYTGTLKSEKCNHDAFIEQVLINDKNVRLLLGDRKDLKEIAALDRRNASHERDKKICEMQLIEKIANEADLILATFEAHMHDVHASADSVEHTEDGMDDPDSDPDPDSDSVPGPDTSIQCITCGKEGHKSVDCPKQLDARKRIDAPKRTSARNWLGQNDI